MNDLSSYESALWQIIRHHSREISLKIDVSPCAQGLFYYCELTVNGKVFPSAGVHLWKRYRFFLNILKCEYE